jgi:NAD(P)-dependent dehydrogenase (short-subunit alcohol dehydrogenase family)
VDVLLDHPRRVGTHPLVLEWEIHMSQLFRSPFDRHSTASEVIDGVDLSGKRAVITGATSGIGVETARVLAAAGAEVTLAVRRPDAGELVASDLRNKTGNQAVHVARVDVADLDSVTAFTAAWRGPVHILINNAGIMMLPDLERGIRGHEQQFATNYLGHFALTLGLRGALAAAGGARIVSVSSTGHLYSPVVFDDLDYRFRPYDALGAYGQSKTAQVLLAVEADRRWSSEGIRANALHPGAIATNLQRHTGGLKTPAPYRKTIEQGAATSVFLAASPLVEDIGGRYFEDVNQAPRVTSRPTEPGVPAVAAYALDPANAERLWDFATSIVR